MRAVITVSYLAVVSGLRLNYKEIAPSNRFYETFTVAVLPWHFRIRFLQRCGGTTSTAAQRTLPQRPHGHGCDATAL
jgi:hypothetical protein